MRTPLVFLCAAALLLMPFAPAAAEPEPDNALWEATGPVLTDTVSGTLSDWSDPDWYMLYAAASTPLTVTLLPGCKYQQVTLRDANGLLLAKLDGSDTSPSATTYTTGSATTQLLLRVGTWGTTCAGSTYSVTLSPPSALLPGPPMPTATPLGEPNESPQQAIGPLAGDTWYSADLVAGGDQDYYTFYADSPVTVMAVTARCGISGRLWKDDGDDVAVAEVGWSQIYSMTYSPNAWQKLHISFSLGDPLGCAYHFLITPASAVKSGPRPLAPPSEKVQGLTYKKVGKHVVVRWKAVPGATCYESRYTYLGKYVEWSIFEKTLRSFRAKIVPKKGMKMQVRARNDDGAGPARTIRVRL